VEQAASLCEGDRTATADVVTLHDLNSDGTDDWIVDSGAFQCSTSASLYCGPQECGVDPVIDGTRGTLILSDWDTLTEGATT